ncbi:MAG TPA: hypothetical protein VGR82_12860 [Methylomirabilota bacterium]|jgi:hypothetical protein|nr:hypothetical protein [Methylomirabilota bacterium]
MSSRPSALLSATFWEPGYEHLVEPVHQRDAAAVRHLSSLDFGVYDEAGKELAALAQDPAREILDLDRVVREVAGADRRLMVLFDARYDERIFPYRPHHYAYLHRRGSTSPALYYAVNGVLGGVPNRIGAVGLNNFETYLFRRQRFDERYSVMLGNPARFTTAEAEVFLYYDRDRDTRAVSLAPKAHVEVELPGEHAGQRLRRVEVKGLFRLASYVVGRRAASGDLVLFDHLFRYFT